MNRLKTPLRILVLLLAPVIVSLASWENLEYQKRQMAAQESFERAMEENRRVMKDLERVENRLYALATDIEAAEREVREQFKMIKPGERLYLIQERP